MDLSELTVRLLLLFFPGIICHAVAESLTVHRERQPYEVFLRAFVFGLICYGLYAVVVVPFGVRFNGCTFWYQYPGVSFFQLLGGTASNAGAQKRAVTEPIDFGEIFLVALVSGALGVLIGLAINKGWWLRLAYALGITKKFNAIDVWMHAFDQPGVLWANIRDASCDMMYQGYILATSEETETREIFLSDVNVYNEATGKFLYKADRMYVSRDRNAMTIELPYPPREQ